ncbi:hypothetical protein GCM10010156_73070 [Planobispora rosea]|uniref:Uncharacterized protein n=1 Tax=Planobispora rosea TaxID=35762 RepID=A0A8J3SAA1_PLARO|nr:hypothetical protein [Planobispora rosea]GGT04640.1 hypothetical protein GCM10010156_73070 [Planobispora rosea]GIH88881.1 hypothetical protein Pro02_72890 [Planobispora rosea]
MKRIRYPIPLLNHPVYRDPDGEHTYVLTPGRHGVDFHVPGCPAAKGTRKLSKVTGTYKSVFDIPKGVWPCRSCQPHGCHKVTLPDGTDRYRPMGPIAIGRHGDQDEAYGNYALCDQFRGKWRVREWAPDGLAALARAQKLGVTVILGPPDARYGLPIGPEAQQ